MFRFKPYSWTTLFLYMGVLTYGEGPGYPRLAPLWALAGEDFAAFTLHRLFGVTSNHLATFVR